MEEQFWQTRWDTGRTAFHEGKPNEYLVRHLRAFQLAAGAQVFVPLCGKTDDLDWLLDKGHRVTGIEFNRGAIEQVFERLDLAPDEATYPSGLTRLSRGRLTLWHGDFFLLQKEDMGAVDAVYDRAALVALPDELRGRYAKRLSELTDRAPQLLISYDYDQAQMDGPPFSVPEETIQSHYQAGYEIELLDSAKIMGPLADRCRGEEQAWKLSRKTS